MIYGSPSADAAPDQGDIIEGCPILQVSTYAPRTILAGDSSSLEVKSELCRIVVITQTCDLANAKTTAAVVARLHAAQQLVDRGLLRAADVRGPIRSCRVYGWYFLPASSSHGLPESIVDLRQLHTVRLDLLECLAKNGKRLCRIAPLYREHLAQHLAVTYSRIGLPEPYETQLG
jgi:hypothetical protein